MKLMNQTKTKKFLDPLEKQSFTHTINKNTEDFLQNETLLH
jgi:hypothetical protein